MLSSQKILVSVVIVTKNEATRLARCLSSVQNFDDIIVVDSNSEDDTQAIAAEHSAQVIPYTWDGQYPKKRQWCLDNLTFKHDFVFFIDGDEVTTPEFIRELQNLDFSAAGYFIKGQYIWKNGEILKHGLSNNKLALINRHKIEFPIVNDLNFPGMGEIEGHYQPVLKSLHHDKKIGVISAPIHHHAYEDSVHWRARHLRYAAWEAHMIHAKVYPQDVSCARERLKNMFRRAPLRNVIAFLHSYVLKCGFLDGRAGFDFSLSRATYYHMVSQALKKLNKA